MLLTHALLSPARCAHARAHSRATYCTGTRLRPAALWTLCMNLTLTLNKCRPDCQLAIPSYCILFVAIILNALKCKITGTLAI